jgi:hypothetical protein
MVYLSDEDEYIIAHDSIIKLKKRLKTVGAWLCGGIFYFDSFILICCFPTKIAILSYFSCHQSTGVVVVEEEGE